MYSLLAETLQAPLAYLTMYEASRGNGGMLLGIAQGVYRPSIITGIPALTRNIETANILRATQEASAIIPALVQLSKRFDPERLVERIFANNSVDLSTLSKDPDVVAAEAEQEAALAQQQLDVASGALAAETSAGVLTS